MFATICENHFEKKYILSVRLASTAIPTLQLPTPIDGSRYLQSWDKENEVPAEGINNEDLSQQQEIEFTASTALAEEIHHDDGNGIEEMECTESTVHRASTDLNEEYAATGTDERITTEEAEIKNNQRRKKPPGTTIVPLKVANSHGIKYCQNTVGAVLQCS